MNNTSQHALIAFKTIVVPSWEKISTTSSSPDTRKIYKNKVIRSKAIIEKLESLVIT